MGREVAADEESVQDTGTRIVGDESGFTIIEVLVAAVVLVVGLLGVLAMVDQASSATAVSVEREAATNVAREVLEQAHAANYDALLPASTAATLRTAIDPTGARQSAAVNATRWTIRGRTTTDQASRLTVDVTTCSVLAPSRQIRVIPATLTPCTSSTGGGGGGGGGTVTDGSCQAAVAGDPVIGVTIRLLVDLSLCTSGAVVNIACTALGPTQPLTAVLAGLVGEEGSLQVLTGPLGGGISTNLCGGRPVSSVPNGTAPADDARRVTAEVRWGTGAGQVIRQTTVVPRS
jgi:Tfp pilus assembly protein PilV